MVDLMPTSKEQMFAELRKTLSRDSLLKQNEPLAKRTTLRVGGAADLYAEPASDADLAKLLQFCREHALPFMILGRGSNLLIRDGGIRGLVICLANSYFSKIDIASDKLICGAGAKLKHISVEARRHNLSGLEFLEGIPGSLGGALRMNAGAMGSATFDVLERIRFMNADGAIYEKGASDVMFDYRSCPLLKENIALGAVLKANPASPETIAEKMKIFSNKRWDSQPAAASAGCTFKNTPTVPAGKLIDELGLKGTRVGGAAISDVHGNFLVNEGKATATDVLNLIQFIKRRAKEARGIELETEVEIVGEDPR
jgi:UDP-N-acetylenolpyruvoylglucosamine reductase